ncbi:MAG: amphi-Trp domain-containing protein [Thermodesulfobacteriota bacterium]
MAREVVLFKSEETKSAAEVATILRQAAEKIEHGALSLLQGAKEVVLEIPGLVALEIKAEEEVRRQTKRSLEFELEWVMGEEPHGGGVEVA